MGWGGPGLWVGEGEPSPVPGAASAGAGLAGWCGESQYPIGAHPHQHLDREIGQQERQAGIVVAAVADDPDLGVAFTPVSGGDQRFHHGAELGGGQVGVIVIGTYAGDVE